MVKAGSTGGIGILTGMMIGHRSARRCAPLYACLNQGRLTGPVEASASGTLSSDGASAVRTTRRSTWQPITRTAVSNWRGEIIERRKDGSLYTTDEVISPLRDDNGTVTHFVAVQHDITLRKQEAERERFLAYHDALTGLCNRVFFLDLVQQAIWRSRRSMHPLALLFLDLDHFKLVNDTSGHETGDRLLVLVAERLGAAVRKTTDAVARLSGDEFAILQTDVNDPQAALSLANKLLLSISQPFVLKGRKVHIGVSIGIAIFPTDGELPEELLRNADKAMYLAKNRGGGNCQFYDRALCKK